MYQYTIACPQHGILAQVLTPKRADELDLYVAQAAANVAGNPCKCAAARFTVDCFRAHSQPSAN